MAIPASNDGKVVWASDLGIYGNCVVVDHGYGLQSIYGHMSQIGVKVGDMVKSGQTLGRSGSTGLAGGDHLHFSMQLDGVQVNPVRMVGRALDQRSCAEQVEVKTAMPSLMQSAERSVRTSAVAPHDCT